MIESGYRRLCLVAMQNAVAIQHGPQNSTVIVSILITNVLAVRYLESLSEYSFQS